jgi:hypothetical protein
MKQKKITLLFVYFGIFPDWIDLFFQTVRNNSSVSFIFYTDCDFSNCKSSNVIFHKISFQNYIELVRNKLKINFKPKNAYKLCDLKLFYGLIHYEDIKDSDYYGYADFDLLFGDIRSFYTDEILENNDIFSTHETILSGHFSLFKNIEFNRNIFKLIGGWKEKIESPYYVGIDEYTCLIKSIKQTKINRIFYKFNLPSKIWKAREVRMYLKEQYTTPFTSIAWLDETVNSKQPDTWFYKNGIITNSRDGNKNFIYIHFMNFKSSKYRHDGSIAPWEKLSKISHVTIEDMITGIVINNNGIYPLITLNFNKNNSK